MRFLTTDEVIALHVNVIHRYGGAGGVRDAGLLDAAVHAPQASFGGRDLYPSLFDKAAVYLIHISCNHAFVDGNKRSASAACLLFLRLNGVRVKPRWKQLADIVVAIAAGQLRDWKQVAKMLEGFSV